MPSTRNLRQQDLIENSLSYAMPSVDLSKLPHDSSEVEKLNAACLTTGFFTLENTLIGSNVIDKTLMQMDYFFSLEDNDSIKQKVRVTKSESRFGWTPMFGEPAYQPGTIAHMESFDFGLADGNYWPHIDGFQHDARRCWSIFSRIGDKVLQALALAAGINRLFFSERCASRAHSTMRLLHYPANNTNVADANVGIAAHTDFECITLIVQTAPGLELRDIAGRWFNAPAEPGRIVVLLGDMLERWTNGRFQATGHRVRNTLDPRMSIIMFFAVNDGVVITPLAEFVNGACPARYEPVGQREHIDAEVAQAEYYRDNNRD